MRVFLPEMMKQKETNKKLLTRYRDLHFVFLVDILRLHLHPHFQLLCGRRLFFLLFDSPVATLRWFYFSAVALSILSTLRLPSPKISNHSNNSHILRFLRSSKLCCPDAKPQCYLLQHVLQCNTASIMNTGFNNAFVFVRKINLSAQLLGYMLLWSKSIHQR